MEMEETDLGPASNQEILAILKANRDLGADYDDYAAEQILALIPGDTPCSPEQASAYLAQLPPP